MENHPIPQDVTGFQFKLIGNMTVKQFAYLAIGVVFAAILWQLPVNFLIKFPFCAFSALLGIGLAYFPISGRPMDLMISSYIKALFRPTQFIYVKTGGQIYYPNRMPTTVSKTATQYTGNLSLFPKDKLKTYIETLGNKPKDKADQRENSFMSSVSDLATGNEVHQPSPGPDLNTQPTVAPQPTVILQPIQPTPPIIKPEILQPSLVKETVSIKPQAEEKQTQAVVFTPRVFGKTIGALNIPDSPNLVTGITRDARGNALTNILVEIRDKEGNPVRAFRTNEFGRFASATPLANGTYMIQFEDPRAQNKFEQMAVNVTGQIILPIEAISVDAREELRKSLFSANAQPN
jgi:hypothetical protein